jgi:divinyl protochlorophyllide a 8-vinyl-reductase
MKTLALEREPVDAHASLARVSRIGPNAIIQLAEAGERQLGPAAVQALFRRSGLSRYLAEPPTAMVDEEEVIALHRALRAAHPPEVVRAVSWEAGLLTGDYILANRIPKPAQLVLRLLPARLAARALTTAITKHAWTFAGSGSFRAVSTFPLRLEIADSPICRGERGTTPLCDYYAGTFTRLYQRLVDRRWRIVETHCGAVASGKARGVCVFEVAAGGAESGPANARVPREETT